MSIDPIEVEFNMNQSTEDLANEEVVGSIASSNEWTAYQGELAKSMYVAWRYRHGYLNNLDCFKMWTVFGI